MNMAFSPKIQKKNPTKLDLKPPTEIGVGLKKKKSQFF